jgi:predicted amidohydrolase
MLHEAHAARCDVLVYPELALTTFFPRWDMTETDEIDSFFEREMPDNETRVLFEEAARLSIGFYLGYAELAVDASGTHRYNTAILVNKGGRIVGKYRKIHLPGTKDPVDGARIHHLEKRYFEVGDLGFKVWNEFGGVMGLCICNDRRWPETYRVLGLQGVEMVMVGYNTPVGRSDRFDQDSLALFHNHLVMQAGAYQNATWVVGAAKCGLEEGSHMIGQSVVIAPSGEIAAMCTTLQDELIVHRCNLDHCRPYRDDIFNFLSHRRPEHYRLIVDRVGVEIESDCKSALS